MPSQGKQAQLRKPRCASTWNSSSASWSSRAATRRASPCPHQEGRTHCHSEDQDSSAKLQYISNQTFGKGQDISTHEHIDQHQHPSRAPAARRPCARCCSSGTRAGCPACGTTGARRPCPHRRSGRGATSAPKTSCATRRPRWRSARFDSACMRRRRGGAAGARVAGMSTA